MNKNPSSSLSEDRGEAEATTKVRVYKFTGTLKTEFSNMEQAQEFAASLAMKHPNLLFEPYAERRSGQDRRMGHDRRNGGDRRTGSERREDMERRSSLVE